MTGYRDLMGGEAATPTTANFMKERQDQVDFLIRVWHWGDKSEALSVEDMFRIEGAIVELLGAEGVR